MTMVAVKTGKGHGKNKRVRLQICDGGGTCCWMEKNRRGDRKADSTDTYKGSDELGDCAYVSISVKTFFCCCHFQELRRFLSLTDD